MRYGANLEPKIVFGSKLFLYICGKKIKDMKLTFFIRLRAKKVKQLEVPVYVRLRDESMDIWQKTFIMVAPEKWDPKTENLKTRIVIPAKEREEF